MVLGMNLDVISLQNWFVLASIRFEALGKYIFPSLCTTIKTFYNILELDTTYVW